MLPLGEFAFQFVKRALDCKYFVVVCFEAVEEISSVLGVSEDIVLKKVLGSLVKKRKLELVYPSPLLKGKALVISGQLNVPFNDALFAVVAAERNVLIVTRDNHFSVLAHVAESVKPEELD